MFFISISLKSRQIDLSNKIDSLCNIINCDLICFDISIKLVTYNFILLYRPPNSSLNKADFSSHKAITMLTNIINSSVNPQYTTIIAGDFDLPEINWQDNTFPTDGIHNVFIDSVSNLGLHQFITEPTRISNTGTANTLDLIFSNDPCSTYSCY